MSQTDKDAGERIIDPHEAVDFIIANGKKYAQAKSNRVYIEEFRKSKKALLMNKSPAEAFNAREQYAYSNPEYIELLDGLKSAVEIEEKLKWLMRAAELRVEVWRTQEATNRNQDRNLK